MSGTGTPIELEDVLSSIRRLVSQETIGLVPAPAVPASETAPEAPVLVLTPAQRVDQTQGNEAEIVPGRTGPEDAEEVGAPVSGGPAEARDTDASDWPAFDEAVALAEAGTGAGTDAPLTDELARLEDTIAEMEATVVGSEPAFEGESGDLPGAEGAMMTAEPPEAFGTVSPKAPEPAPANEMDAPEAPMVEWVEPEEGMAKVAEFAAQEPAAPGLSDTLDVAQAQDPDPDDQPRTAGDPAADWMDDTLLKAQEPAPYGPRHPPLHDTGERRDRPDGVEPDCFSLRDDDLAIKDSAFGPLHESPEEDAALAAALAGLDEAALRRLVADLIRKELQGALGERITRNVRKLVRREINRALVSRDFE